MEFGRAQIHKRSYTHTHPHTKANEMKPCAKCFVCCVIIIVVVGVFVFVVAAVLYVCRNGLMYKIHSAFVYLGIGWN